MTGMCNRGKWWVCLAAFAALFIAPAIGSAETDCDSDDDCEEGFTCESYDEPCPTEPCEVGEDCDSDCEPETVSECIPEPPEECESVDDCTGDEVCVLYTYEVCEGSGSVGCTAVGDAGCEEEEADAGSDEYECSEETEGYCLPPWLAPCETDSDCGEGFACEEEEIESCSGSAGVPDDGGDSDGADAGGYGDTGDDYECETEETGESFCVPDQECDGDGECPGDMICEDLSGDQATCTVDPDGNETCEDDGDDTADEEYCVPDDFERWIGLGVTVGSSDSSDASGGGGSSPDDGESDGSYEVDREDDGSDSAGQNEGCATGATDSPVGGLFTAAFLLAGGLFWRRRRS